MGGGQTEPPGGDVRGTERVRGYAAGQQAGQTNQVGSIMSCSLKFPFIVFVRQFSGWLYTLKMTIKIFKN